MKEMKIERKKIGLEKNFKKIKSKFGPTKSTKKYLRLKGNKSRKQNKKKINKCYFISMISIIPLICIILYFIIIKYKSKQKTQNIVDNINNKYLKQKVCICTLGKEENRYIREWIAHYEKYGIDKIYLYDNNDENGEKFEDIIKDYIDKGFVEILNWRGRKKILNLVNIDCYQKNYDKYDWILFYEIDEYINLHNYTNVKLFVNEAKFNNCQIICLNSLHHTDNNQLHYENKPLSERFPETVPISRNSPQVKSILRGHIPNIDLNNIHIINKKYDNCNGYGHKNKISNIESTEPDYKYYYIDHYYCKSTEEFIEKINKGDALFNTDDYKLHRIDKYSMQVVLTKEKIEMIEKGTGLSLSKFKSSLQ
jgi:hypothetical protein